MTARALSLAMWVCGAAAVGLLAPAAHAAADEGKTFALIIGTNTPLDKDLAPLRYADDDAARYFDLFENLGASTYLLTRLDDSSERLHERAAARAHLPRHRELAAVVELIRGDIAKARARGQKTTFYFIYAGHGNVEDGRGYITLEDDRLFGDDLLDQVIKSVEADSVHMIVDACYSFFLAYERGAGGKRRPASGFSRLKSLSDQGKIGLILSTSAAAESHEWEAYQAGVFSHEVRSGLYGAADANHDGSVSYRELAAFVATANSAIPNEKYRPKLHARPPGDDAALINVKAPSDRYIEVSGEESARYFIETREGVRLVDFFNAPGEPVRILRPRDDIVFVRRLSDNVEFEVHPVEGPVRLASLSPQEPSVQGRGSAHHAFSLAFTVPFGERAVARFEFETRDGEEGSFPFAAVTGGTLMAAGAVVAVSGAAVLGTAIYWWMMNLQRRDPLEPSNESFVLSQEQAATNNNITLALDAGALALTLAGVGVGATGAAFLLWPGGE